MEHPPGRTLGYRARQVSRPSSPLRQATASGRRYCLVTPGEWWQRSCGVRASGGKPAAPFSCVTRYDLSNQLHVPSGSQGGTGQSDVPFAASATAAASTRPCRSAAGSPGCAAASPLSGVPEFPAVLPCLGRRMAAALGSNLLPAACEPGESTPIAQASDEQRFRLGLCHQPGPGSCRTWWVPAVAPADRARPFPAPCASDAGSPSITSLRPEGV